MKKNFVDYELTDNRTGTVRILAADKIKMESHARMNGWELVDGPRTAAYMLYAALTRSKAIEPMDFDAFLDTVLVDYAAAEDNDPLNPTN